MASPAYRLRHNSVHVHKRIIITMPTPGRRCTDGVHNLFLKHNGQGFSPNLEQALRKQVNTYIVVFKIASRLQQFPVSPVIYATFFLRAVCPVTNIKKTALPVGGLGEQVPPGYSGIMCSCKVFIPHILIHLIIYICDKPAVNCKAGNRR